MSADLLAAPAALTLVILGVWALAAFDAWLGPLKRSS